MAGLPPDEQSAHDDPPRRGVWIHPAREGSRFTVGDGRFLSQTETNTLIVTELLATAGAEICEIIRHHVGEPPRLEFINDEGTAVRATAQRGGLHDDPLVRTLAHSVWRDRDRDWWTVSGQMVGLCLTLAPCDPTPIDGHREHLLIGVDALHETGAPMHARLRCECGVDFYYRC